MMMMMMILLNMNTKKKEENNDTVLLLVVKITCVSLLLRNQLLVQFWKDFYRRSFHKLVPELKHIIVKKLQPVMFSIPW